MKKLHLPVADICGWYGTGAILLAYVLVSFSVLKSTDVAYQLLNLSGALGLIVLGVMDKVYETVTLNVVWAVVALIAVLKIFI